MLWLLLYYAIFYDNLRPKQLNISKNIALIYNRVLILKILKKSKDKCKLNYIIH